MPRKNADDQLVSRARAYAAAGADVDKMRALLLANNLASPKELKDPGMVRALTLGALQSLVTDITGGEE